MVSHLRWFQYILLTQQSDMHPGNFSELNEIRFQTGTFQQTTDTAGINNWVSLILNNYALPFLSLNL